MPTRRQEKVARVVKEAISDAIANHLNDPRIEGLVSVTRVEMTGDLRSANVYISVLGKNETVQSRTFTTISHAGRRIQILLGDRLQMRFCPVLHFYRDDKFKKTLEILNLIDRVAAELPQIESDDADSQTTIDSV